MPIVFEEVTGEIAPPASGEQTQTSGQARSQVRESPLEHEAEMRRRLALLAEREHRAMAD